MVNEQSEALRLADALEDDLTGYDGLSIPGFCQNIANKSAAELRRLHAENETLEAQRDELLNAVLFMLSNHCNHISRSDVNAVRAAIAKVTGETK